MRKQADLEREPFNSILPEYGRRKLLTYADSIKDLAESYKDNEMGTGLLQEEKKQTERNICGRSDFMKIRI